MIDTVALTIEKYSGDSYDAASWKVERPDLFDSSDIENYLGRNWHLWNKRSKKKQLQEYFPHVEIRNWAGYRTCYALYVRFSIPKLVYGNNLLEVTDSQFNLVCQTLQSRLQKMGICVGLTAICGAVVQQVHYGKNILCPGVPVEMVLARLAVAKPCMRSLDIQKTTFRNGQMLTFHNKMREVCFYDKYKEILSAHKKDPKLAWLFKRSDLKNILRVEVRLNQKASFKLHFGTTKLTFQDVCNEQQAKKIITAYWDKIYKSVQSVPPTCYAPEYQLLAGPYTGVLEQDLKLVALRALVNSMGYGATYKFLRALYPTSGIAALCGMSQKNVPSLVLPAEYDVLRMIDVELKRFRWLGKQSWCRRKNLLKNKAPLIYQRLLTVEESSKYAKVNKRTLQKWLKQNKIGHFLIGKEYRLRKEDLFALFCGVKP